MRDSIPTRGILIIGVVILGLFAIAGSKYGPLFENILYISYGLAMPVLFLVIAVSGIYFAVRHLLTA